MRKTRLFVTELILSLVRILSDGWVSKPGILDKQSCTTKDAIHIITSKLPQQLFAKDCAVNYF